MRKFGRTAFYCGILFVANVVAVHWHSMTGAAFGQMCNTQVPEDPAPACGCPCTECEDKSVAACPEFPDCGNVGTYAYYVALVCDGGGGPTANCKNAMEETECAEKYACFIGWGPEGLACTSNEFYYCETSYITPKVNNPNCTPAG